MSGPPESPSLRNDLRANLGDGAGFSVMVGIGESYLPAFALALGMGEVLAGLVASVPMLAGAVLQLASPAAVRRLGSHRRWVVICAACQALSFLPLVAAAVVGRLPVGLLFLIASVYWGAGLATGPAWNTWMETIIPRRVRPRFFAARTRLTQAGMVSALLVGGTALQIGKSYDQPLMAFALCFCVAFVGRCLSTYFLARQSEPSLSPERLNGIEIRKVLGRFRKGGGSGLLFYLLAVQSAVWLSAPYFTPYMLKKLHLSYGGFALLTAGAVTAKVIALPYFGRYAQRLGARRLLWIGGLGIVPLSGLWLVSDAYLYLMVLQVAGGVAWAAYELAMFLLFFETIDAKERTSVLTIFNVGNALATVAGSLLGWALLKSLGGTQAAYLTLFLFSSISRCFALLLLARVTGVLRLPFPIFPIATRGISVSPAVGSIDRPILASLPTERPLAASAQSDARAPSEPIVAAPVATAVPRVTIMPPLPIMPSEQPTASAS